MTDHQPTDAEAAQKILRQQNTRIERLSTAFIYQLGTCSLTLIAALIGLTHILSPIIFLAFIFINTGCFYLVFRHDLNLKFRDPNLTQFQIILHYLPPLVIMYFLETGHARTAYIVMALVPISFGVFLLNTKQFLTLGVVLVTLYTALMGLLFVTRPEVIHFKEDILVSFALVLAVLEISFIGGYITSLRSRLKQQNQQLNEALITIKDMANRDALTGIFNRRYLNQYLQDQVDLLTGPAASLSLCLVDIDGLKAINDNFGHHRGDEVLQIIAQRIHVEVESQGCVGRYGGEEFLVVLPKLGLQSAKAKADHIRTVIAEMKFTNIDAEFPISVSVGIAQYEYEEDIMSTIERADLALFEAKSLGRNNSVTKDYYPMGA